ncbi:MAG TPA: hypothetical protein VJT67_14065 [Longimicrobiaceae bacterium]|nr:hypothetical protein [Longimicrobiaceae bacterium]
MKILCPACRVPVAADDVNLETGLAKCRTCNNVFRFDDLPELAPSTVRARPKAEKPRSVVTTEANGELVVQYRWFSAKYLLLLFFCLFWDGFLVFWYAMALGGGGGLVFLLFPLIHVAAGIAITYATIAGFVNTTTVRIDGSRLSVRHHPLPWGRPVELGIVEVKQLFCEEKLNRGRNGVSYTYNLNALLHDGVRKKLVSGLDTPEIPMYLEQHAEEWMKIRDEPVVGELPRV